MNHAHEAAAPQAPAEPIVMTVEVPITAFVYPEPGGGYSVRVSAMVGRFTEGDTLDEVWAKVHEVKKLP